MNATVNIYSVYDGKLLYSFFTDKPFKSGNSWNENVNVYLTNNDIYQQVVPCSVVSASEILTDNGFNVQHVFVKPSSTEAYYKINEENVSNLINNVTDSVEQYFSVINNVPNEVKSYILNNTKIKNLLTPLCNNNQNTNQITIKKGDILCFEAVNLSTATKNVWVALIDSYDPVDKKVNEVVSVTIMGDNVLTENLDTLDDIVYFGSSFKLDNTFIVRKPTESELVFFTKKLKAI